MSVARSLAARHSEQLCVVRARPVCSSSTTTPAESVRTRHPLRRSAQRDQSTSPCERAAVRPQVRELESTESGPQASRIQPARCWFAWTTCPKPDHVCRRGFNSSQPLSKTSRRFRRPQYICDLFGSQSCDVTICHEFSQRRLPRVRRTQIGSTSPTGRGPGGGLCRCSHGR